MKNPIRTIACVLLLAVPLFAANKSGDYKAWIKSPEAYFATAEEVSAWSKVTTPEDAEKFIADYWAKRGPQFRKDVLTRIEKADELFSLPDKPGSKTEMGRVWMLLGSPNRTKVNRGNVAMGPGALPGSGINNSVEQGSIVATQWIYQKDHLPLDAGLPELIVKFQTNASRGQQTIENPGLVEPYLKKVAAFYLTKSLPAHDAAPAPAAVAVTTPATAATMAEDPLWAAGENLAGAFFDADAYLSPADEKPFYAVNFYVPKSAPTFAPVQSVLMVGLVKDSAGKQVAAVREQLPLKPYGQSGDRYVDRSFALPPGKYTGMFALFTPEGTTMLSNRRVEFTVAAPTANSISQLFPTAEISTFDTQLPLDPFTFVATKYAIKGDRRFTTKDKIGFFTVIANPGGDPDPSMTMGMKIYKNGQLLHKEPPQPAPLTQTGPHTWLVGPAFEPGTFEPGDYTIELQFKDLKAPKEADGSLKGYTAKTDFHVQ